MENRYHSLFFFYIIVTNTFVFCEESTFVCINVHVINSQKCCERCRVSIVPLFKSLALILNWNVLVALFPNNFFGKVTRHTMEKSNSIRWCSVKVFPSSLDFPEAVLFFFFLPVSLSYQLFKKSVIHCFIKSYGRALKETIKIYFI